MENQNNNIPSSELPQQIGEHRLASPNSQSPKNHDPQDLSLPMEFNFYPMPNRKDSMSHRGLDETDFPKRKFKQLSTKRDFSLNNYSLDIEGAAPRSNSIFTNKIDYSLKNEDIEKSSPKPIIPETTNKPNFNLSNKDIEGTQPIGHHCFPTNRHINPLNPKYPLPSCPEKFPPEVPKFLRNTLDVRDIPGATTKKNLVNVSETEHNYMDVYRSNRDDHILLSHKKLYKGNKNKFYNSLDFRDVYTNAPYSKRNTNPLEPRYKYDYQMTEVANNKNKSKNCFNQSLFYGEIEGNRPVVFSKYNNERYGKGMKTEDIPGAQPSTTSSYAKFELKYNHPLKYSAEDIIGAHHDTIMKSIITKRNTNPLEPQYQFLGDKGLDFDEDGKKFRARYDYNSLKDFYYNNSKIAIKQRKEEMENNNKKIEEEKNKKELINSDKNKDKKVIYTFNNFGVDKKVYPIEKVKNTEYENKIKIGEKYLEKLKEKENNLTRIYKRSYSAEKEDDKNIIEKEMKDNLPDPNDMPEFNEVNNFDSNNYKKPEIYYPIQHDEFILPSKPNNKSGKDMSIKALQDLQTNFENSKFEKNNKNSGTYANQLDKFIRKFPGLK